MLIVWDEIIPVTVEDLVEDLRRETRGQYLKDIIDTGGDIMVTCPSHSGGQERNPSCGISKEDFYRGEHLVKAGTVHCFTCGYKGDLPKLAKDVLGLKNDLIGMEWIKSRYFGIGERRDLNLQLEREEEEEKEFFNEEMKVFEEDMKRYEEGKKYLTGRGIDDIVIDRYRIGYNKDWNSIVFPVRDIKDNVTMFKERKIDQKRFKNKSGSNKGGQLFGVMELGEVGEKEKVFIVESEIDVLSLANVGKKALSIMGSSVTEEQMDLISLLGARHIVLGCDNDKAGRKGNRLLYGKAISRGMRVYNVDWKKIGDVNDWNDVPREELIKKIDEIVN